MKKQPKWKWAGVMAKAKKKYSEKDIEEALKLHFQSGLISHIQQELFEYDIIKEHDHRTLGFFSFLATWIVHDIYSEVKKVIQDEDKFRHLSPWDVMTYDKIKALNEKRNKFNSECNLKEFQLVSQIDITNVKGYNKKDGKIYSKKEKK